MKIVGRRSDGALYLSMGAGVAVIMKGLRVTRPLDEPLPETMGPWAATDNSFEARRSIALLLDRLRVAPLEYFVNLAMSFDQQRDLVTTALRRRMGLSSGPAQYAMPMDDLYIPQNGMGEDWVVFSRGGKQFGMVYDIDNGAVVFDGDPVEVGQTWETLADRVEDATEAEPTPFDDAVGGGEVGDAEEAIALKHSPWFKKFMADKKGKAKAKNLAPVEFPPSGGTTSLADGWAEDKHPREKDGKFGSGGGGGSSSGGSSSSGSGGSGKSSSGGSSGGSSASSGKSDSGGSSASSDGSGGSGGGGSGGGGGEDEATKKKKKASGPAPSAKDNPSADAFNGIGQRGSFAKANGISDDKNEINVQDRNNQSHVFRRGADGNWVHHSGKAADANTQRVMNTLASGGYQPNKVRATKDGPVPIP